MIAPQDKPKPVRVGHWFRQAAEYDYTTTPHTVIKPFIKELRFDGEKDYTGLLHGFATEGDGEERLVVALVEKPDGTFATPSVNTIQLLTPTK